MIYTFLYLSVFTFCLFMACLILFVIYEIIKDKYKMSPIVFVGSLIIDLEVIWVPLILFVSIGLGYWFIEHGIGWHAVATIDSKITMQAESVLASKLLNTRDASYALEKAFWRGAIVSIPIGIAVSVLGNTLYEKLKRSFKRKDS